MLRRPRHVVDAGHAQALQVLHVVGGNPLGQFRDRRLLLLRLEDELVIDIRDIDHQGDPITKVSEKAFDGVEDDRPNHVAQVAGLVNGGPADVHADPPGVDRLERFLLFGQRVIDVKAHGIPHSCGPARKYPDEKQLRLPFAAPSLPWEKVRAEEREPPGLQCSLAPVGRGPG